MVTNKGSGLANIPVEQSVMRVHLKMTNLLAIGSGFMKMAKLRRSYSTCLIRIRLWQSFLILTEFAMQKGIIMERQKTVYGIIIIISG